MTNYVLYVCLQKQNKNWLNRASCNLKISNLLVWVFSGTLVAFDTRISLNVIVTAAKHVELMYNKISNTEMLFYFCV